MSSQLPYFLGCPVWACDGWVGSLYSSKTRRKWLREYSSVFNTVEGNSTFYGLPSLDTVRRWAEETRDGFRFVLKFPREISHEKRLLGASEDTLVFLRLLDVLAKADRLGPTFLQLPPSFSAKCFADLAKYLSGLPRSFRFAVEVRHFDYFDDAESEGRLTDLLTGLGMDWVLFDSRGLYSQPPSDEYERESQRRKPRTPFRTTVTSGHPVLRLVGRNDVMQVYEWLDRWAEIVADWIQAGLSPFVFTHSPDDSHAPEMAEVFHNRLRARLAMVPALQMPIFEKPEQQGRLF